MRKFLISAICTMLVLPAFAAGENVATSKAFVDTAVAQKQDKIPANVNGNNGPDQVLTNTGTAGNVGTKDIYSASGEYATQMESLVDAATMNAAVQNAINAEFKCVQYNPNDPTDCWLVDILGQTETRSKNLFDVSKIPTNTYVVNNGDGTLTVTGSATSSAIGTGKRLSALAPELEVGKKYTLSFLTTSRIKYMTLINGTNVAVWDGNSAKRLTQDMLDALVYFQSGVNKTSIISNIQIEEGTVATPYQPYGANVYMPSN